jgi:N-acetylmuramoyl-L-alanine amidase
MPERYTVKQGDTLGAIATEHGLASWRDLYDHPDNQELRRLRPNPGLLFPGDTVILPERRPEPRAIAIHQTNRFTRKAPPRTLRLVVRAPGGEPLAGNRYELRAVPRGFTGTIPPSGEIRHTVPAELDDAELLVWGPGAERPAFRWKLRLGHLDPLDTLSGVQARLNNLGHDAGPVDGADGPLTQAAVRSFRERDGLGAGGGVDEALRARLAEAYGC